MSKFMVERIQFWDKKMQQEQYPNCKTIVEEFGCERKTAVRDIQFMRVRLGANISFSHIKNGYYYADGQSPFLIKRGAI